MCGSSGPSSADLVAQSVAAKNQAQAEADKIRADQDANKQEQSAKMVADQVAAANSDAARRAKNRTLLAGLDSEEGTSTDLTSDLVDPTSKSAKKAKRGSLIGALTSAASAMSTT